MEDDHGMTSPSNLSSRGAGSQMSPSNSETSESRCMHHIWTFPCTCVVTNINFLLTISIQCQEIRLWELIKWSPKRKCYDLLSNSLNLFFKEMYRSVWRIWLWILGLKGLRHLKCKFQFSNWGYNQTPLYITCLCNGQLSCSLGYHFIHFLSLIRTSQLCGYLVLIFWCMYGGVLIVPLLLRQTVKNSLSSQRYWLFPLYNSYNQICLLGWVSTYLKVVLFVT